MEGVPIKILGRATLNKQKGIGLAKSHYCLIYIRGDEWSIKIFNCLQNFTFARLARKI